MWLWSMIARAEPSAHWHPDDLAPLSSVFLSTSERLQQPFGEREADLGRLATALRQYREALDLLGDAATAEERSRLDALEKDFAKQRTILSQFADQVVTDYDTAFMTAVQRALLARGGEIEECPDEIAEGPAMPGMAGRTKKNTACHGPSINADLAQTVDSDPSLKASLDEILARSWPSVSIPSRPQAPVPESDRYLSVSALFAAGARDRLTAIDREDDNARLKIEAALEDGASAAEIKALEAEANQIEAATAAKRAALASGVLSVMRARIDKKWISEPSTGLCANPALLGGCTGEDASKELVSRLMQDKKVLKAFAAAK